MTDRITPVQNEVPEAAPAPPGRAPWSARLRGLIRGLAAEGLLSGSSARSDPAHRS